MLEVFGKNLLETMHKNIIKRFIKQESEFDKKTLTKLIQIVKVLPSFLHLFVVKKFNVFIILVTVPETK
jgi:hypothetical protein